MALNKRILLFGDQTVDVHPEIKHLFQESKRSLKLQSFLQNACDVLHVELEKLNTIERERFQIFHSILDLAELHKHGDLDIVISTTLLTIVQLGSLILASDKDSSILAADPRTETRIIGLCTGLLPASAAATAQSTSELLNLAPVIICIALRLAFEADNRSSLVEKTTKSWATVVPNIPVEEQQDALDEFHHKEEIPSYKQAYISAEGESTATISGPPSVLSHLFLSSVTFSRASKTRLPISAAFHACHLRRPNIQRMITSHLLLDEPLKRSVLVTSTSSGTPYTAGSLMMLLHRAIDDILQSPLRWDKIRQSILDDVKDTPQVTIIPFGPISVLNSLRGAFDKARIRVIEQDPELMPISGDLHASSGDVAIVVPGNVFRWDELISLKVTRRRFDTTKPYQPLSGSESTSSGSKGYLLDRPGLFDARLFNMSPSEATQTDPSLRLMLLSAYEALEMAGHSQEAVLGRGRTGTFVVQATSNRQAPNTTPDKDLYYTSHGRHPCELGRLNYHFQLDGPSYSMCAACSSSSTSVQLACNALLSRDCDTALAGGCDLIREPAMLIPPGKRSFLSSTGIAESLDQGTTGYCRGEAVGIVVLKRLEDAVASHDNILGTIKSAATAYSAHLTYNPQHPSRSHQKLYKRALHQAVMDPEEIDYVEMHSIVTSTDDTAEADSVSQIFGQSHKNRSPLYVGSLRTNAGYECSVTGIISLIKATMILQNNVIPPNSGMKADSNHAFPPSIDAKIRTAKSPVGFRAREGGDGKRRILLNDFSSTGGNTSLILEDPPRYSVASENCRSIYVTLMTAMSASSLRLNKLKMIEFLSKYPETKIADISYTTTARRIHHGFRTAYTAKSTAELLTTMQKDIQESREPFWLAYRPSVAFIFSGQGSQYPGMGRRLFGTCETFRQSILEFDAICVQQGITSFLPMIVDDGLGYRSVSSVRTQLALASLDLALALLWRSWGVMPHAVIGHGLGEYPALCFAGVISVTDMLFLVGQRALLTQSHCTAYTHVLLDVHCSGEELASYFNREGGSCGIACRNGNHDTIVSGPAEEIEIMMVHLKNRGIKSTILLVPYAYHSSQIDPMLNHFYTAAETVQYSKPTIPVASTLRGDIVIDAGIFSPGYLTHQTRHQINFVGALQACRSAGLIDGRTMFIECGPSPVCLGMAQSILGISYKTSLPSIRHDEEDAWKTISRSAANAFSAGVPLNWTDYHKSCNDFVKLVDLPKYAFDLKDFPSRYESTPASLQNEQARTPPNFPAMQLQRIERETIGKNEASVSFVSSSLDSGLFAALQYHSVGDARSCPSTVYADMALTAAAYVLSKTQPLDPVPVMDISEMKLFHPLVSPPTSAARPQLIKVTAVRKDGVELIEVLVDLQGGDETQQLGRFEVNFGM